MPTLLHHFIQYSAASSPNSNAIIHKKNTLNYDELKNLVHKFGQGVLQNALSAGDRVAIYLPKRFEAVVSFFGCSYAGVVFVPINPLLKPSQVEHILNDCNARILITSNDRLNQLNDALSRCPHLSHIIDVNDQADTSNNNHYKTQHWQELLTSKSTPPPHSRIDSDIASILYTSGSTGKPKGVVLSHRNMVTGAQSVAEYLQNTSEDNLLAVLPFSFDYGLSQLTTAFSVGASVTLMDYLLPRDVIKAITRFNITGLAGVPPLWNQLAQLDWGNAKKSLRYITNSGGAMPTATLEALRTSLPGTSPYLMYGLTEAFRSTYLPPEEIDNRPGSMGKAIPNAEVQVVREDGTLCRPNEPGELVHRGSLVSLGYWNDPEKTAKHFKPAPQQDKALPLPEIAVWSGDKVTMDEDGFLYFIARQDDMIKTSGYRVSPSEVEDIIFASGLVSEAVALGVPHPVLGQAIVIIATSTMNNCVDDLFIECKKQLPNYMHPAHVEYIDSIPKNPNGKIDRKLLAKTYENLFN